MKKILLALLWVAATSTSVWALDITDDRGVTVHFDKPPQRIVTLLPSLTETVCELGQCHRLVGIDRYSNFPAQVQSLPRVGGGIDPNIEAVDALKPDVVLMATSSRGVLRLEALGVKVLAMEPKSAASAQKVMARLGELLEVRDAARIWRAIDAGVSAVAQSLPPRKKPLRVYYEVSVGGFAAGTTSFIGETMARLGVANVITPDLGPFPRINPEYVVRADPDIIMIGQRNVLGMAQRPGWAGMRAMRENRVCVFTAEESDVLVRPGPRMAEGARLIAKCLTEKGT